MVLEIAADDITQTNMVNGLEKCKMPLSKVLLSYFTINHNSFESMD